MSSADPLTFHALERFAAGGSDTIERPRTEGAPARLRRIRPEQDVVPVADAATVPEAAPMPAPVPDALPLRASKHVNAPRRAETPRRAPVRAEKARFYRPELFTGWERFIGNRVVQVIGWTALVAGTVALLVFALTKFSN